MLQHLQQIFLLKYIDDKKKKTSSHNSYKHDVNCIANLGYGAHPLHGRKVKVPLEVVGNFVNQSKKEKKKEVYVVSENPSELKK